MTLKQTLILLSLTTAISVPTMSAAFAQREGLPRETLEALITVPPSKISDDDLELRIQLNRLFVRDNVAAIGGVKLKMLLEADQNELDRRQNQANGQEPVLETQQVVTPVMVDAQNPVQLDLEGTKTAQLIDVPRGVRKNWNREARQYLRGAQPSATLSVQELQKRISETERLMGRSQVNENLKGQLRDLRDADQAALDALLANAGNQGRDNADNDRQANNQAARAILNDNRNRRDLSVAQLQDRIDDATTLLRRDNMRGNLERRLRDFRNSDRAELDRKLAAIEEEQRREQELQNARQDNPLAREIIRDNRAPDNLTIRQLQNRVRSATELLQNGRLGPNMERRLRDYRNNDRAVLERRLAARQEEERREQEAQNARQANNQAARSILNDNRDRRRMAIEQLQSRIDEATALLRLDNMRNNLERRLREFRNADQAQLDQRVAELREQERQQADTADQRRANNQAARAILNDNRARENMNVRQLRNRIQSADDLLVQNNMRNNLERRLRDFQLADQAELDRKLADRQQNQQRADNPAARDILRDNRAPQDLTVRQLRNRVQAATDLLQNGQLGPNVERRLRDYRNFDRTILDQRLADRQQGRAANRLAQELLQDQRRPDRLGLPELRDRVQRTRNLLQQGGMNDNLEAQLLARLDADRTELRNRVARQNDQRRFDQEDRDRFLESRRLQTELFNDRRPSFSLTDDQLDERIGRTVSLLESARMRADARAYLEQLLANDRAEKRQRLVAAREDRRRELERQRRNNGAQILLDIIDNVVRFNLDIVAAEQDNAAIQQQLIAPPRQQITRSYTLRDLQRQPELREFMPGIELDTIRFGSNEAFIRAEEIGNLDAIGEMIEQIVFERPGEVFLIEGHTDAVGSADYNLGLSIARAEAVRQALLQYYYIPAENLEIIGYGERFLRIPTLRAEQENRRVSVRRITPLLNGG